jgi:hypothetical protein
MSGPSAPIRKKEDAIRPLLHHAVMCVVFGLREQVIQRFELAGRLQRMEFDTRPDESARIGCVRNFRSCHRRPPTIGIGGTVSKLVEDFRKEFSPAIFKN